MKIKLVCICLVLVGLLLLTVGPALADQYVEFTVHSRVGTLTQVSVAGIEGEPGAYVALTPQGERYPISQEGIEIEGVTYTIPRVQAPRQGGRTLEYAKLASDGEEASLSVDNVRTMVEVGTDWYQTEQDLCAAGAPPPLAPASCSQGQVPWSWQSYDKKLQVAGGELSLVFYVGYYTGRRPVISRPMWWCGGPIPPIIWTTWGWRPSTPSSVWWVIWWLGWTGGTLAIWASCALIPVWWGRGCWLRRPFPPRPIPPPTAARRMAA